MSVIIFLTACISHYKLATCPNNISDSYTSAWRSLQARAVNDLHVNSELATVIVENENTDATAARLEGSAETGPQVGLINDGQALLDITSLGHGNNVATLEVQDTVLLEDRAKHGLDNHAGGGVGDERRLLVQLAGEEINTEIAVLASG